MNTQIWTVSKKRKREHANTNLCIFQTQTKKHTLARDAALYITKSENTNMKYANALVISV